MSFVLSEELLSARIIFRSTQTGCLAIIILSSSEAIKTDMEKGGGREGKYTRVLGAGLEQTLFRHQELLTGRAGLRKQVMDSDAGAQLGYLRFN